MREDLLHPRCAEFPLSGDQGNIAAVAGSLLDLRQGVAHGLLGQGDLEGVLGIASVGWQGDGGGPHPAESGAGQALAAPLVAGRPAVALAASHPAGEFWESPAQGGGPRRPALLGSGQRALPGRGTRGLRPERGRAAGAAGWSCGRRLRAPLCSGALARLLLAPGNRLCG